MPTKKNFWFLPILFFVLAGFLFSCEKIAEEPLPTSLETMPTETIESTEPAPTEQETQSAQDIEDENNWEAALARQQSENNLLALIEFAERYPNSNYIHEALTKIRQIQEDPEYSKACLSEPDLESIDEFLTNFPGHMDADKILELRQDFVGDIFSLMQKELILAISVGDSISRSIVQIQNNTKSKLEITIPLGTYFAANGGNVQNMLAREQKVFALAAEQTGALYISTACMNIYKDIPGEKNYFTLETLEPDSPLLSLLNALCENESSYEVA
ncbi:MAG: hypothetical protein FWH48_10955, partial [Oscillospiraceae bacterium]|nr:hypothetical protein [Oscillospiraceae bacterium]